MNKIIIKILTPIYKELPFFGMFFIVMSYEILLRVYGIIRGLPAYNHLNFWDVVIQFSLVFLFSYVFASLINVCKKKWVKVLMYSIFIALFAIDFYLERRFEMSISPKLIVLLSETNPRESMEFFQTFMGFKDNIFIYGIVFGIIVISFFLEKYYHHTILPFLKSTIHFPKSVKIFASILIAFALLLGCYTSLTYVEMFDCEDTDQLALWEVADKRCPQDPLSKTLSAFYGIHLVAKEKDLALKATIYMKDDASCMEDSVIVVFVIGESYIKQHASIYGYPLNTTPHFIEEQEAGNLYSFSDVCTPSNMTSYSMKYMLCCNSLSEDEAWHEAPYFPAVFKNAGFDVLFWDNQKSSWTNSTFTFALNSFLYNELLMPVYAEVNEKAYDYDGEFVDSYVHREHRNLAAKQLVVFHLMGQHVDAAERYPHDKEFLRFTADSILRDEPFLTKEKKEKIAHYDNATYYNDFVLKKVTDAFRDKNAVVVYSSDHGEEIYDYRDSEGRCGGDNTKDILSYQYGVPFVIWCSPTYQERHADIIEAIKGAVDKPFMTDNVCQVLFHLARIETGYYHPDRDPLCDQYRKPKRLVKLVNRTIDYDAFVK